MVIDKGRTTAAEVWCGTKHIIVCVWVGCVSTLSFCCSPPPPQQPVASVTNIISVPLSVPLPPRLNVPPPDFALPPPGSLPPPPGTLQPPPPHIGPPPPGRLLEICEQSFSTAVAFLWFWCHYTNVLMYLLRVDVAHNKHDAVIFHAVICQ